ncbi:MAG: SCP2 sterol-binding domain-containing protein [Spirochaetes bacterium]|nr:SCP2 sterol-binding domain-containing protein [Spirochaetota bacterium]MBU1080124.1 SCP2 sterol-binding domain-containing protein [Spirochaetota bacterium]
MMERTRYLSEEWAAIAGAKLRAELDPQKMNKASASMSNIYERCSDGVDRFIFIECSDGELARFEVGSGEPPKAEFRIHGDYDTFAMITRGELGSQKALMTGRLKLKGNMAKALRLSSLADRINKVLAGIPTDY